MASTNKTTTLELSQFVGTDVPGWLTDYNSDMSKIDAFATEANSNISAAEQSANNANTTAQAASTAANQAVANAQNAVNVANQANENFSKWRTVNLNNPNAGKFTSYNGYVKYNKVMGIAFIVLAAQFTPGTLSTGDIIASVGSDFGCSSKLRVTGLINAITASSSTDGKSFSYTGEFESDGSITFQSSANSDAAIISICRMVSLAGCGNDWAQST